MTVMRVALFILLLALIADRSNAQLPGTWDRREICDTCTHPVFIAAQGGCAMAVTMGIDPFTAPYPTYYFTTFTTIDTGNTWEERHWNTQYTGGLAVPSIFNRINLFSGRTTDDRRGTRPTVVLYANDIITSFNIGLDWDYGDYGQFGGRPFMLQMFDPRHGLAVEYSYSTTVTTVKGVMVTDTGHRGVTSFEFELGRRVDRADGLLFGQDSIVLMFQMGDSLILVRSIDAGKTWDFKDFTPGDGMLFPLAAGTEAGRLYAVRRSAKTDLLASTTGGTLWDTVGPSTGRVMNVYESAPDRLWMLMARDTGHFPVPLPYHVPSAFQAHQPIICDTFYFSSDGGRSWAVDASFARDTIAMMAWASRDIGYVLSKRDGKTYISQFRPFKKNEVVETPRAALTVTYDRTKHSVMIKGARPGEYDVRIVDMLGRERYSSLVQFDEHSAIDLPLDLSGVLLITIRDPSGRSTTHKLLAP